MSCRSTPCGAAVSSVATALSGRSADDASAVLHALRSEARQVAAAEGRGAVPATEVLALLESFAFRVRHDASIPEARRRRVLAKVAAAAAAVESGAECPDAEDLAAWRDLPAELEARAPGPPRDLPRQARRPYHLRFRNFDSRTLEATDALFSARPSRLSEQERDAVFRGWVDAISDIYGMERPALCWDESADSGGGGFYTPARHAITMSPNHPSVTTLIHETRHALQHAGKGAAMVSSDIEEDARAWSLSLYHRVRPRLFARLVREGRILHIAPGDLDA